MPSSGEEIITKEKYEVLTQLYLASIGRAGEDLNSRARSQVRLRQTLWAALSEVGYTNSSIARAAGYDVSTVWWGVAEGKKRYPAETRAAVELFQEDLTQRAKIINRKALFRALDKMKEVEQRLEQLQAAIALRVIRSEMEEIRDLYKSIIEDLKEADDTDSVR